MSRTMVLPRGTVLEEERLVVSVEGVDVQHRFHRGGSGGMTDYLIKGYCTETIDPVLALRWLGFHRPIAWYGDALEDAVERHREVIVGGFDLGVLLYLKAQLDLSSVLEAEGKLHAAVLRDLQKMQSPTAGAPDPTDPALQWQAVLLLHSRGVPVGCRTLAELAATRRPGDVLPVAGMIGVNPWLGLTPDLFAPQHLVSSTKGMLPHRGTIVRLRDFPRLAGNLAAHPAVYAQTLNPVLTPLPPKVLEAVRSTRVPLHMMRAEFDNLVPESSFLQFCAALETKPIPVPGQDHFLLMSDFPKSFRDGPWARAHADVTAQASWQPEQVVLNRLQQARVRQQGSTGAVPHQPRPSARGAVDPAVPRTVHGRASAGKGGVSPTGRPRGA